MSPADGGDSAVMVVAPGGATAGVRMGSGGATASARMGSGGATASARMGSGGALMDPAGTRRSMPAVVVARGRTTSSPMSHHRSAGPRYDHRRDGSPIFFIRLVLGLGRRRGFWSLLSIRRQRQSEGQDGNQAGDTDRKKLVCTRHDSHLPEKGSCHAHATAHVGGFGQGGCDFVRVRRSACERPQVGCKWRAIRNDKRSFLLANQTPDRRKAQSAQSSHR